MMQLTINRIISSRIREILLNILHLIPQSANEESVSSGIVFVGGVTKTDYFEESLRMMDIPFRMGQIRSEFVDESINSTILNTYATELALLYQATAPSVVYEVRTLDKLFDESDMEEKPTTPATPVEDNKSIEEDNEGYTFEPVDDEEIEDVLEDEENEVEEEPKNEKVSGWFERVKSIIKLINAGDED